jgi:hypothetical protein
MKLKCASALAHGARVVLVLLLGTAAAFGQANTGAMVGTVHDGSGAVMPGVTITIRNEGTNASRTVVTTARGDYSAPLLPPGNYEITLKKEGYLDYTGSARIAQDKKVTFRGTLAEIPKPVPVVEAPKPKPKR